MRKEDARTEFYECAFIIIISGNYGYYCINNKYVPTYLPIYNDAPENCILHLQIPKKIERCLGE